MNLENKVRISTLVLLFLVFSSISLNAQNKGLVTDEKSNNPLTGVNVYSTNKTVISVTNNKGEFNLRHFSGINEKDTLCFSHVGYITKKITLLELKGLNYTLKLTEDDQQLKEITVVSEKIPLQREIQYKELASMKEGLFAFGASIIGDKICVIGGDDSYEEDPVLKALNDYGDDVLTNIKPTLTWYEFSGDLYVYDLQTNKWTTSKLKFDKRAGNSIHYFDGKIYNIGGKIFSRNGSTKYLDDKIEVYDIKKNNIRVIRGNPHQAINFASVVYKDNLIVLGGSNKLNKKGEKEYSNKVHLCNMKSGLWYELGEMPDPKETKGVLIKNTIYLMGGFRNKPLSEIETYNVETGEWKHESRQLLYEVQRPGIASHENMIYIFDDGKIQTYNTDTKELNAYLIDLKLKNSELFYSNDMLYILGGSQKNEYSVTPSSSLYRIDLNEFKRTETSNNQ